MKTWELLSSGGCVGNRHVDVDVDVEDVVWFFVVCCLLFVACIVARWFDIGRSDNPLVRDA